MVDVSTFDPGHQACRHNLGLQYIFLERFRESVAEYEELLRRGSTLASSYQNLAEAYLGLGDSARGVSVSDAFVKRNPENAFGFLSLGQALIGEGRYDDAIRAYSRAAELNAADGGSSELGRAAARTLREDWNAAESSVRVLSASSDETERWFGAQTQAGLDLFHGHTAKALLSAERVATAYQTRGQRTALGHQIVATILLAQGRNALAAAAATRAMVDAKGTVNELSHAVTHAWALSAAGRSKDADAVISTMVPMIDPLAQQRDRRAVALAKGLAALGRGDSAAAVEPLQEAQAALPVRSPIPFPRSHHVPTWSALGRALFETGRLGEALPWFQKVAASGQEHLREPIDFVRSFYFLGRIYEQQGDTVNSRDAFRRFVGYWKDGDIDRDRIAEALRKIGG